MKKTVLHAAILALTAPLYAYGLGLGQMTVKSALDQPFSAEIELEDIGNVPAKEIKVSVADPENFTQIGLERAAVLSLLNFSITKNDHGKEIIKVQSEERISAPYMELVVDLVWPQGQLYKAYTILLDPPGYHLTSTTIQGSPNHYVIHNKHASEPGVIERTVVTSVSHHPLLTSDNRKAITYGPTVANESVWQIAQRYKTTDIILPQVVLAIVGANPNAFADGNLNGLKVGTRLTIPATSEIKQVPADLATSEAMAHDKAWNDKTPIEHILMPPYTSGQAIEAPAQHISNTTAPFSTDSVITPLPTSSTTLSSIPQLIPTNSKNSLRPNESAPENSTPKSVEHEASSKAELSITISALESVRESNVLLKEQLHLLQKQNTTMQKQLDERNIELNNLRSQIHVLLKQREGFASQANSSEYHDDSLSLWPFIMLFFGVGSGVFAYWYLRMRTPKENEKPAKDIVTDKKPFVPVPSTVSSNLKNADGNDTVCTALVQVIMPAQQINAESTHEKNLQKSDNTPDAFVTEAVEKEDSPLIETESSVAEQSDELFEGDEVMAEEENKIKHPVKEQTDSEARLVFVAPKDEHTQALDKAAEQDNKAESVEDGLLQFESGLHKSLDFSENMPKPKEEQEEVSDGIDFVFSFDEPAPENRISSNEEKQLDLDDELKQFFVENDLDEKKIDQHSTAEESQIGELAKSEAALTTLLSLAKTYLGMEDFESARHSLIEVIEHGNQNQKAQATQLLESIKNK